MPHFASSQRLVQLWEGMHVQKYVRYAIATVRPTEQIWPCMSNERAKNQ
jgi:hypothetical protein